MSVSSYTGIAFDPLLCRVCGPRTECLLAFPGWVNNDSPDWGFLRDRWLAVQKAASKRRAKITWVDPALGLRLCITRQWELLGSEPLCHVPMTHSTTTTGVEVGEQFHGFPSPAQSPPTGPGSQQEPSSFLGPSGLMAGHAKPNVVHDGTDSFSPRTEHHSGQEARVGAPLQCFPGQFRTGR